MGSFQTAGSVTVLSKNWNVHVQRCSQRWKCVCKFIWQMTANECIQLISVVLGNLTLGLVYSISVELRRPEEGESVTNEQTSLEVHLGLAVWGSFFSTSSVMRTSSLVQALQASQADSLWARYWRYNRADIIGPYSFLRDNPCLGLAFSVPSVIFSLVFTQGMYQFLLVLRLLLWLYTQHVCLNVRLWLLLSQRGC